MSQQTVSQRDMDHASVDACLARGARCRLMAEAYIVAAKAARLAAVGVLKGMPTLARDARVLGAEIDRRLAGDDVPRLLSQEVASWAECVRAIAMDHEVEP